ncbi:MAG: aminotransferase class I/II-fold pyridoxal phosphate-dependent enzyme, partial [Thermoleophilia bacterium]|nr:aminotransferase class I/II-fold pyridoxal phosphate-dependent enzyme [Thermoleophilia bacterium]
MRKLPDAYEPYAWAISTAEAARIAGIPTDEVLRFDGNVPPKPPPTARPETIAAALEKVNLYPHGGYPLIHEAIAEYAGVEPGQVVLGAGADDLIMLCARAFAEPGDSVAIADEPTYPLFRLAAWVAGAEVDDRAPALTFCCRPHNPTGALVDLPQRRPLVVDEAYFEYAGETAASLLDDGVIVIRTFSKAFGLASARIGYLLADAATAGALRERQHPAPVSTPSVALALAGLAQPPDVGPTIAERERLAARLRTLGLDPLPSWTNFLYAPLAGARQVAGSLAERGLLV